MSASHIVLVTSGLGNAFGGVGVVTELMAEALSPLTKRLSVWRNPLEHGRRSRAVRLGAATLQALGHRPRLIVYEHVDLARLSVVVPWLRGIPYLVFLHGTEVWRPHGHLRRLALTKATALTANSAFTVETARLQNRWLPPVGVTWLGVRPPEEVAIAASAEPIALIVGRMTASERQKGHDRVLDAWPAICAAVPGAQLRIIGDGDDVGRLQSRARHERLARVAFLGRLGDTARNAEYAASRLFLFPSTQEGFGLAAVEAAVRGCPVLALGNTVMEELFPRGSGVVFASGTSAEDIAMAAGPLMNDAAEAARLGAIAKQRASDNFLAAHFVTRFRERVEAVLNRLGSQTASAPKRGWDSSH